MPRFRGYVSQIKIVHNVAKVIIILQTACPFVCKNKCAR
jgi:hypothetical protein